MYVRTRHLIDVLGVGVQPEIVVKMRGAETTAVVGRPRLVQSRLLRSVFYTSRCSSLMRAAGMYVVFVPRCAF